MDSGSHRPKLLGLQIPDYLTWGETHVISGMQLSTADVLLVRHVICPQGEARVRDE